MPSAIETPLVRYSRPSSSQAAADAIPILVDGEYHIFHLSTPPNTVRHPPRLRSTRSRLGSHDLVSWEQDELEALRKLRSQLELDQLDPRQMCDLDLVGLLACIARRAGSLLSKTIVADDTSFVSL